MSKSDATAGNDGPDTLKPADYKAALSRGISEAHQSQQGGAASLAPPGEPVKRPLHRRLLVKLARPFLNPLRAFANQPVLERLNATSEELAHLRSSLAVLQSRLDLAEQQAKISRGETGEIVRALQKDTGYAHAKLDELRHAVRPVLRLDDAAAVPLADGYVFLPPAEERLLLTYAAAGSDGLEPGTRAVMQRLLVPGMHAIDVGANIGAMTLVMGRAVGPEGKVDSFEAESRLEPFFNMTKANNGLAWATLHSLALGAKAGTARFNVSSVIGHSSLHDLPDTETSETVDVEVNRLDDVLADDQTVDLIKIDVEGAELEVLAGAQGVLSRSPDPAVIAEFGISHLQRTGISTEDWLGQFGEYGLEAFAIREPSGQCVPADIAAIEAVESVNLVFVKPGGAMYRRLDMVSS